MAESRDCRHTLDRKLDFAYVLVKVGGILDRGLDTDLHKQEPQALVVGWQQVVQLGRIQYLCKVEVSSYEYKLASAITRGAYGVASQAQSRRSVPPKKGEPCRPLIASSVALMS